MQRFSACSSRFINKMQIKTSQLISRLMDIHERFSRHRELIRE